MNKELLFSRIKLLGLLAFLIGLWWVNSLIPTNLWNIGIDPHLWRVNAVFMVLVGVTAAIIIFVKRRNIKLKYIIAGELL